MVRYDVRLSLPADQPHLPTRAHPSPYPSLAARYSIIATMILESHAINIELSPTSIPHSRTWSAACLASCQAKGVPRALSQVNENL